MRKSFVPSVSLCEIKNSNMTILQVLKKNFIDDPIARTKRIYFDVFHWFGKHFPFLYAPFYYWWILRPMRIGKDGRVGMLQVTSEFVYGCNLRCEFCSPFSPYLKGYIPADELLQSFAGWSKKIKPKYVVFSGGEPFLHPDLAHVLRESAKIWKDSKLWLTTNGLLLERANPEVLQAIKATGCELIITEHTFDPEHRKTLDSAYKRLKREGVRFCVRQSRTMWLALYQYDDTGRMIPYESDPKKAWNCCIYRQTMILWGDKMYKCTPLLHADYSTQKGVLDAGLWKTALTYKPLTLESTPEEIVNHLRGREIPECTICFEKPTVVPSRQLPLKSSACSESVACPDGQGEV